MRDTLAPATHRRQAGMTLVELMVATTLFAIMATVIGGGWGALSGWMHSIWERTDLLREARVAQAYIRSDMLWAGRLVCENQTTLVLWQSDGIAFVEYTIEGSQLLRHTWPLDTQVLVAQGVGAAACIAVTDKRAEYTLTLQQGDATRTIFLQAAFAPTGGPP